MIDNIPQYDGIGVYKITHPVTGRVYIGSSLNCKKRLEEHSKHPQNKKMEADADLGAFTAEIVKKFPEGCTNKELAAAERYYIQLFETTTDKGYNSPIHGTTHNYRRGSYHDFVFSLTVPKGDKEIIKAHAEKHDGGSVNSFIQRAIKETMQRDQGGNNG